MSMTLGDETFRPLLTEDMLEAWELVSVGYDPPQTENRVEKYPRGFLQLLNVEPAEFLSFSRRKWLHRYQMTGQFLYTLGEEGTLEEYKVARANELLAVLTAGSSIYHDDWRYRDISIDFETSRLSDDRAELMYSVLVEFTLEWETGV